MITENKLGRLIRLMMLLSMTTRSSASSSSHHRYSATRATWSARRPMPSTKGRAVRTPLKELLAQLDEDHFVQMHRVVAVNLRAVSQITRGSETATIHLKHRGESLPVSLLSCTGSGRCSGQERRIA